MNQKLQLYKFLRAKGIIKTPNPEYEPQIENADKIKEFHDWVNGLEDREKFIQIFGENSYFEEGDNFTIDKLP